MNTNTTSNATSNNNAWIYTFFLKKHYQRNININHIWVGCKAYKDHFKSNCVDNEFKQQLRHGILNKVKLFLDAWKDDVVNVETNNNIKQSYNFMIK